MARTTDPELDIYAYLAYAYQHQIFQSVEDEELVEVKVDESQTQVPGPAEMEVSAPSLEGTSEIEIVPEMKISGPSLGGLQKLKL